MALCFWAMGEDNRKQNIFGRNNVLLQSTGRTYTKSSREAEQKVVDFAKTGPAHWQPRSWCSLHPCSGADLGFCTQNPSTSGTFGTNAFGNAPCHAATIGMGTPRPLLPVLEIGARLAAGLAPSTSCTAVAQPSSCTMHAHPLSCTLSMDSTLLQQPSVCCCPWFRKPRLCPVRTVPTAMLPPYQRPSSHGAIGSSTCYGYSVPSSSPETGSSV